MDSKPRDNYMVYNIGNNHPENLMDFVKILSECLIEEGVLDKSFDINSHMELVEMAKGDVPITYADVSELEKDFGFKPSTSLKDGLSKFAKWYKGYYIK